MTCILQSIREKLGKMFALADNNRTIHNKFKHRAEIIQQSENMGAFIFLLGNKARLAANNAYISCYLCSVKENVLRRTVVVSAISGTHRWKRKRPKDLFLPENNG